MNLRAIVCLLISLDFPIVAYGFYKSEHCDASSLSAASSDTDLIMCRYGGNPCAREAHMSEGPDPMEEPLESPESVSATTDYQATEEAVYNTCGGLGCIEDPSSGDPTTGKCGIPTKVEDCAGTDFDPTHPEKTQFRCGKRHLILKAIDGIVPTRFFLTASAMADSGFGGAADFNPDLTLGFLFQIGLSRSKTKQMPDGGLLHYDLPNWFLHAEVFASKFRVGHDLSAGYKTGSKWISRFAFGAVGQYSGETAWTDDGSTYRIGPAVHIEIYYNIILKGGWLPLGNGQGPVWIASITVGARFTDDFKLN